MNKKIILDNLSEEGKKWDLLIFDTLPSTNSYAKEIARSVTKPTVILAYSQSNGRGSKGRDFFCQKGKGIYISFLFKPSSSVEDTLVFTTATATVVCKTMQLFSQKQLQIKWVNDIYSEGKKLCGILTEGGISDGKLDYAVVGIGVNLSPPEGGFPEEISSIAGTLFENGNAPYERIVAALINNFASISFEKDYYDEYLSFHFPFPKEVTVIKANETKRAIALSLDKKFRLQVQYEDGTNEFLQSGEISLRF